jgi:hypothetical protein
MPESKEELPLLAPNYVHSAHDLLWLYGGRQVVEVEPISPQALRT